MRAVTNRRLAGVCAAVLFGTITAAHAQLKPLRVDVTLSEYRIDMPDELAPGRIDFHIINRGRLPHGFAIASEQHTRQLDTPLGSGQSADLTVDLMPGVYAAYSAHDRDRQRGMELAVTVKPAERVPGR